MNIQALLKLRVQNNKSAWGLFGLVFLQVVAGTIFVLVFVNAMALFGALNFFYAGCSILSLIVTRWISARLFLQIVISFTFLLIIILAFQTTLLGVGGMLNDSVQIVLESVMFWVISIVAYIIGSHSMGEIEL